MKTRSSSVTIEDVARAAGVSVSTVSRTINDKPDVARSTKERVRQIMTELGYTPHRTASTLAGGLSKTIALLIPISEFGIRQLVLDFLVGASKATERHDFILQVITRDIEEGDLRSLKRTSSIDGVILMRTKLSDSRVRVLQDIQMPFVMLGRCRDNTDLSYVDLDSERGVELALRYLKDLGHSNIGFIAYSAHMWAAEYTWVRLTREAAKKKSELLGLHTSIVQAETTAEAIRRATEELLSRDPGLTAIVTVYGELASTIERVLSAHDLRVPEDVSIIAIMEEKTARLMTPTLGAVTLPSEELGAAAAEMLIKMVLARRRGESEPTQLLVEPTLVEGETTARRRVNGSP